MIKQSSGRKQKCMSTQIQSCVRERCIVSQKRMKSGKARSENSTNQTSTQSCLESMENQLSSSETFSQDSHRLRFSERFRKIWRLDEQILNNLRNKFYSCRCSTIWIGQRTEICFKNVRGYAKDSSEDTGHSSVLEMKNSGMERTLISQKENETMKPIR